MAHEPGTTAHVRRSFGPRAMTLSDMAALVFGTALVPTLPWENHLGMIGVPEPRWVIIASFVRVVPLAARRPRECPGTHDRSLSEGPA